MTHGERTWLSAGVLLGFAFALAVIVVFNRKPATGPAPTAQAMDGPDLAAGPAPGVPMAVQLTPQESENIGLRLGTVGRHAISSEIIALGRVEELGTAVHTVSAAAAGRIDRVLVSVGQQVAKGTPIAALSSPELTTAADEYRSAIRNRLKIAANQTADVLAQADAAVEASRRRLEMRGLSPSRIKEMADSSETSIQATIYSDSAGLVRTVNVTEGRFVAAGEVLAVLADLNTILVRADIYDSDIARIRPGARARISGEALPGIDLNGAVTSIDSRSDPQSGTTSVRIQVRNPGMRLRPGMFVRAVFEAPLGSNVLSVPRTAVIDTGMDKIVYIALDNGFFERRSIKVGAPGRDEYPIVEGLAEGDRVVTNGAFFIDSQVRLTGGSAPFGSPPIPSVNGTAAPGTAIPGNAYRVAFRIVPDPPAAGSDHSAHVTVTDSSGQPVSDAQVRVTALMPAMPSMGMPEMRRSADLRWVGPEYVGRIDIGMAGSWNVIVEARRANQLLATYRTHFDAR